MGQASSGCFRSSTCLGTCLFFSALCTSFCNRAQHRWWSNFIDWQSATCCDLFWAFELPQSIDGCANNVDGVRRAHGLRQHIVNAGSCDYSTHWTTGDNTGTGRCWTQQDNACGIFTLGQVRDGGTNQWDAEEVLLGFFYNLGDGCWYFFGFAVAHTDHAFAVTYDDESGEGETTSTLDHFGNAVNLHNAFQELVAVVFTATTTAAATFATFRALATALPTPTALLAFSVLTFGALRGFRDSLLSCFGHLSVFLVICFGHSFSPPSRAPSATAAIRPWYL